MTDFPDTVPINPSTIKAARRLIASDLAYENSSGELEQFRLVFDANVVLGDIYWLVHNREDPDAKTRLQQLILSETVLPTAPTELRSEIEEHLKEFAERYQTSLATYKEHWEWFEDRIEFRDVNQGTIAEDEAIDPDDLPYFYLSVESNDVAAVYSKDSDLSAMGAPVVGEDVIPAMLEYARATGAQYSLLLTPGIFATVCAKAGISGGRKLVKAFGKLPPVVQGGVALVAVWALINPNIRKKVASKLRQLQVPAKHTFEVVGQLMLRWAQLVSKEKQRANDAHEKLESSVLFETEEKDG